MKRMLYVTIELSNASGQSLRTVDADIAFCQQSGIQPVYMIHVVPPTTPGSLAHRYVWLNITPTTENQKLTREHLIGLLKLNVSFTDASGNRWRRTWSGDLQYQYNVAKQSETVT